MTRAKDISKIVTDANLSGTLEVTKGASGATANAAADELVLQNSGDAGLSILSPNANNSQILLGSPVTNAGGIIRWTGDDNAVKIGTNNTGGTLRFHVGGFSEVMRISSAGNVGIGTSSPADVKLSLFSGGSGTQGQLKLGYDSNSFFQIGRNDIVGAGGGNFQIKPDGGTSIFDITSGGNVGIGTNSPSDNLHIASSSTWSGLKIVNDISGGAGSTVTLNSTSGLNRSAFIRMDSRTGEDGLKVETDASNLVLFTSSTERMRIDSNGSLLLGTTDEIIWTDASGEGIVLYRGEAFQVARNSDSCVQLNRQGTDGQIQAFAKSGTQVGNISVTGSATAYNTSSDYRLKENVTADWDATTRLKQLNPVRFNFIADADTTVDGFLAHEVQSVVPEAITGTHNEVDDDGNPVYQGIDQSKLVPLLVKTIQELEARITALETA